MKEGDKVTDTSKFRKNFDSAQKLKISDIVKVVEAVNGES